MTESTDLHNRLESAAMSQLRDLGQALEAHVDREVRARGKSELADLVADAIDEAGDDGRQLLEDYVPEEDATDLTIIRVAADVLANPSIQRGQIIIEPDDKILGSIPHIELSVSQARHELETGGSLNTDLSNDELPDE